MRKKNWIIIIALLVVVVLMIVLKKTGVIGEPEGLKVSVEKLAHRTITETVNASGKIYPEIEVKVSPDISGEIVELRVIEGDSVRRGDILARIYADIYTTQRDQAAAVVSQEQARVENSRAQLPGLKAALEFAERNFHRQKQLLEEKVISRAEFEQAQNTWERALADYNAAQEGIRGGQAGVASARANLLRADKDLSRTSVLAPMDGVVSLLSVKKGERVVGNSMMAGTEMMRIADMNSIEARVDVGENDIPKVTIGDSAVVEVDAYGNRKFMGVVTQIASSNAQLTTTTTTNEVTSYKVYIRLLPSSYSDLVDPSKPRNFPFRPGMSASADIRTNTKANVLAVPINAVTTREKDTAKVNTSRSVASEGEDAARPSAGEQDEVVFVLQKEGTVKKVVVKTGIQDLNYIEVTSGLEEGLEVVAAPYNAISKTLKDGSKVRAVPKEQLFTVKN